MTEMLRVFCLLECSAIEPSCGEALGDEGPTAEGDDEFGTSRRAASGAWAFMRRR